MQSLLNEIRSAGKGILFLTLLLLDNEFKLNAPSKVLDILKDTTLSSIDTFISTLLKK